jgi:hypothetical protein
MITETTINCNIVNLALSEKDISLILEALLYAGSINVGSEWCEEACKDIVRLAVDIKNQTHINIPLKNLTFFEDEGFEDESTSLIKAEFNIDSFNVKTLEAL